MELLANSGRQVCRRLAGAARLVCSLHQVPGDTLGTTDCQFLSPPSAQRQLSGEAGLSGRAAWCYQLLTELAGISAVLSMPAGASGASLLAW